MMISNPEMIQIYLDKTQKAVFKQWCFQNDITMSQLIRKLIKVHLASEGINPPYSAESSSKINQRTLDQL